MDLKKLDFINDSVVELVMVSKHSEGEQRYRVPIDNDIQNELRKIFIDTCKQFKNKDDDKHSDIKNYEFAQEYRSVEKLKIDDYSGSEFDKIREIFNEGNIDVNSDILKNASTISFYSMFEFFALDLNFM